MPVAEWTGEYDETLLGQRIHEPGVLVPLVLLAERTARVPGGAALSDHREQHRSILSTFAVRLCPRRPARSARGRRKRVRRAPFQNRGDRARVRGVRARSYFAAVDSHTEGMPTRVITGGLGPIPGSSMQERRLYFEEHLDHLRLLLMREPRGHSAMSGAFLQPPTRPDADWGVLFVEVSGLLPMCGHGTIGVATVLVETGMVEVTEPETRIRLDTPAGLVEVRVTVSDGRAERVTLRNVPAFTAALDAQVRVGSLGNVTYDMAFGGNFYALVPAASVGLEPVPADAEELIARGLEIAAAINASAEPVHPVDAAIRGCKHVG